jgi:hypothetical protein
MGLIEYVHDLESPDATDRFKAATALQQMGATASPAVLALVKLLSDLDGVNVKTSDGAERLVPIAERASAALAAIGEAAAGPVIEELKKDNAISAIHCVRALATPALAKRAPISVIMERLLRPKVSPLMSLALCDVLYASCQSPDETQRAAAKSAFKAAYAAGKVPQKYHKLFQPAGSSTVASLPPSGGAPPLKPATAPAPGGAPVVQRPVPPPPRPAPPPPAPEPAAASDGWVPAGQPIKSDVPAVHGRHDRPTSINLKSAGDSTVLPSAPEDAPPRTVERPMPPSPGDRQTTLRPSEVLDPAFVDDRPVPEPSRPPAVLAGEVSYEDGDRFAYRQEVADHLRRGDKLKAVHVLREKTGASLVEALRQIENWG